MKMEKVQFHAHHARRDFVTFNRIPGNIKIKPLHFFEKYTKIRLET